MQTFIPYEDFFLSLDCLDNKRLGKQRVEAFQIINILSGKQKTNAWKNHPAVLMWKDNLDALKCYYNYACELWQLKGFNNIKLKYIPYDIYFDYPFWFGNKKLHSSHRSNLLRKNL